MSWISLEYTDNLGPEADFPALLRKLAHKLRDGELAAQPEDIRVTAQDVRQYVVADGKSDSAAVSVTLTLLAARTEEFKARLLEEVLGVVQVHLTDLYAHRTIWFTARLEEVAPGALLRRRHARPPPEAAEEI